jgi:aromatic ring hydroxylase
MSTAANKRGGINVAQKTPEQYEESLRKMKFKVYLMGEREDKPMDHPIMHGAGSPEAQRIMIARQGNLEQKKKFAKDIAGIKG